MYVHFQTFKLKSMLIYDVYNSYILRSQNLKPLQRKKMRVWAGAMCQQLITGHDSV